MSTTPIPAGRAPDATPPSSDFSALRARFKNTLPLWPVGDDGRCTCGQPDCRRPGKHPAANAPGPGYAIPTGAESGLFVVDPDVKGGVDGIAQLEDFLGRLPKDTFTVATPSGGLHFFHAHPGFHVGCGKLASAIDIKGDKDREGGLVYVVGPGSPGFVQTSDPCVVTPAMPYTVLFDLPISPAPEMLLSWLRIGETRKEGFAPEPITAEHPDWARRVSLGEKACKEMARSKADGEGGKKLFNVCLRLVRGLELPLEKAFELLIDHFNPRCTDVNEAPYPWSDDELVHKLEDARDRSDLPCGEAALGRGVAEWIAARAAKAQESAAITQLAARVAERKEPFLAPECTETGNAELFAHLHGENVRHVTAWDSWLVWDGQRWAKDDLDRVASLVKDVAKARWKFVDEYGTDAKDKLELAKWAKASESRKGRENAIVLAKAEHGISVSHTSLDADPWLLNVANGTIDLRTGELRAHDRADCITKIAPVTYDPAATCPTWERFLDRVTGGNAELVAFLGRALGYSLTGDVGEHVMFFPYGKGRNGKSTYTLIGRELLGDYAKQAAPDLLLAKQGESHPTEQADLHGARFVICQEVDHGRRWAEATLKQLTGGDLVKARRMREDYWEFAPTHKLWVCANHKPQVRGTDEGIWSRIKLIPFIVTIPKEERDTKLLEKLRAELPGILAWAVRGCVAWQRDGLGVPREIDDATAAYRKDEDRVGAFLDEHCEEGAFTVTKKDLFAAYQRWAQASGELALDMREFGSRLKFEDGKTSGGTVRVWKGVRIRPSTAATQIAARLAS